MFVVVVRMLSNVAQALLFRGGGAKARNLRILLYTYLPPERCRRPTDVLEKILMYVYICTYEPHAQTHEKKHTHKHTYTNNHRSSDLPAARSS